MVYLVYGLVGFAIGGHPILTSRDTRSDRTAVVLLLAWAAVCAVVCVGFAHLIVVSQG